MKTKEELNALKEEYENLKSKLAALNEDELAEVVGGTYEQDRISSTRKAQLDAWDLIF